MVFGSARFLDFHYLFFMTFFACLSGSFLKFLFTTGGIFALIYFLFRNWNSYFFEFNEQFDDIGPHGTKIIVFNLWHNDDGVMELDFHTDSQVRIASCAIIFLIFFKSWHFHVYVWHAILFLVCEKSLHSFPIIPFLFFYFDSYFICFMLHLWYFH